MVLSMTELPPRVTELLEIATGFSAAERLLLAKLLLDTLIVDETHDEVDWNNLSLKALEQEWDNPEDAVYDAWREIYGVPAR